MRSSSIRVAVVLGTFSILFIVAFQVYWVYNTFDITDKQFNQRVSIALYKVADRLAEFSGSQSPDQSPVIQLSSNYFIVDVNESFEPGVLEHFLQSEFDKSHINIDFEYAIYDCETDRMVYGNYISYREGRSGHANELRFRKAEDLAYYFGVLFPNKPTYILQSMNLWFISSLIILTALGFFSYAIFIILRQKRLSEVQKDFINNMTHEFKTPISSIAISAGVLKEKDIADDPLRIETYAGIIADQNRKLEEHIERVLLSASMEKRSIPLQKEPIDLCRMIKDISHSYQERLDEKQEVEVDCKEHSLEIMADRAHLANVLYNMIDNAVKYGGENVQVKIRCNIEDGKTIFSVEDNGPGIHPKHHKKLFDRFYRVPSEQISSIRGFGIGLNYVKYVARAHGWKIKLESSPGNGSKFIIIFK